MPASYPTSVYAPTAKNTGDVVQAAHVNSLDDEVVAIEDGLKNGLQHALTISTGGLTVSTGGSTFGGPVTFNSTVLLKVPHCELTHSTNQPVADNTPTGLNWDTELSDPSGMHSTTTNSSRITFTRSTGLYEVGLQAVWGTTSSGSFVLRVRQNDSSGVLRSRLDLSAAGQQADVLMGTVRAASTTDFITAHVLQVSGSTNSVVNSSLASQRFWAYLVSR